MSAVLEPKASGPANVADMSSKLAFSKKLQAVTNRIHSTTNIDEIMLDVTRDICQLFDADRLTIYTVSEDGQSIVSKVKSGLNSFKDIKLPLSESSIAGCSALNKRFMNIRDVYDDSELKSFSPNLAFLKAVDQRTGYRTKQMMVVPITGGEGGGELLGVIQVINHLPGTSFPPLAEEGLVELSKTLAIAFRVRQQIPGQIKSKFEYLIVDNVISDAELELATRTARRKNKNVEDILIDEFQVKPAALGGALAKYFGVEYEPFKADRIKPIDLLKNLKKEYSRDLADAGQYPAIDIEASISRAQPDLVDENELETIRRFRYLYSRYMRSRDLLAVGAYVPGADVVLDEAVKHYPAMQAYLMQGMNEQVNMAQARAGLAGVLD